MLIVLNPTKWKKRMAVTLHWNTKQETGNKEDFRQRSNFRYCYLIISKYSTRWFSGTILACHVGGPGLIPGQCISFWYRKIKYNENGMKCNKKGWAPSWMHFWQLSEKRINRLFGIRHLHISRKTPCLPPSPSRRKTQLHKHCFETTIQYPRKFGNNGLTKFGDENVVYYGRWANSEWW